MRHAGLLTFAISLLLVVPATAADGRNFAGFWRLGEVTDLGEDVAVTLTLHLHNYTGAEVVGATLLLQDSLVFADLSTFTNLVDIGEEGVARTRETVIVPRHEYERWSAGVTPRLSVEFTDGEGAIQRQPVELVPLLVDEEGE